MDSAAGKLILWAGEKHSGKTTAAAELVRAARGCGLTVAGILAPAVYEDKHLVGFHVISLSDGSRLRLATRKSAPDSAGGFAFSNEGLVLGRRALTARPANYANLVIVDEFGPLELAGKGWRDCVNSLLKSAPGTVLLVIRSSLADHVAKLYSSFSPVLLDAGAEGSADTVLELVTQSVAAAKPLRIRGMLMLGSTGRNSGKTLFACSLIRKVRRVYNADRITAVKVTTVDDNGGPCPRGGEGCGVCSSLKENFEILRETDPDSHKDTSRLLAAGAGTVYWLRTRRSHLRAAANALAEILEPGQITICESNSLRLVTKPDALLLFKPSNSHSAKASANRIAPCADRIVNFDGAHFDLSPERVTFAGNRWIVPLHASAIILAGGASGRMGTDKALLPVAGKTLIEHIHSRLALHFDRTIISAADPAKYAFLPADLAPDRLRGRGPLMGIASALSASKTNLNFVTACDIPQIDIAFVRKMVAEATDYDAVVPTTGPEKYEPLFAVYKKGLAGLMNQLLDDGKNRPTDILGRCRVKFLQVPADAGYTNLNTKADYHKYLQSITGDSENAA